MTIKKLKTIWERMIGKPAEQSLEARIFHAVCIFSVIVLVLAAGFNYALGLPVLSLIMLSVCFIVSLFYYYSRYRSRSPLNIAFYGVISNLVFAINFYYNSGIDGPTLLIFIISFFLIITIAPAKQFWIWISLNIVIVTFLFLLQYNSKLVIFSYPTQLSRYLDLYISYMVIIALIFVATKYLRNSYNSEKKAVEEKASELEIANNTKNKLLSIFAHDLRAPLDSIQSYLELLSQTHLSIEEKQFIEKDLLEKTQNSGQMLSNLLSWTRAQMDGVKVNLAYVSLLDTLNPTIKLQQDIASKKGVIVLNTIDDVSCVVADPDMLQLVVRNLLNNAIKFTPAGGEIVIKNSKSDNGDVILSVKDNGIGIPQAKQPEIFSLKAKSTYGTRNEKGAGLGLVLCKEFTELQNGAIWFNSSPLTGTIFFISFKSCI